MDSGENRADKSKFTSQHHSTPLSGYAKNLDGAVKQRYLEKIECIGIDPILLEGKKFDPDCLPPVESADILTYLVLETSYYTKDQFKNFRSLEAFNLLVSGFVTSVQGHRISDKFVVLAKVRHSQRMNDTLITVWVISEENGVIVGAHCLGCKAGLAESCSYIACALFYLESWTKIHGKLACTQMKCQWILPPFVKDVEYARVRDINFKSAKKLKSELDKSIENLINDDCKTFCKEKRTSIVTDKLIPVPTQGDMDTLFNDLSKCKIKPVILSLVEPYAESYIKSSRHITTVTDLFDKKYLKLSYPELITVCMSIHLDITKESIDQVERDTIKQAKGINFFKHRAGRIGASQSKSACHTNPALPSQSLIKRICYPELAKFSTRATEHGCKHEAFAIQSYEELMKTKHINFKVKECGLIINEDMLWLHATPDFFRKCDCCGEGKGEVKCPLCLENCDFDSYVKKSNACLIKDSLGHYTLPHDHQYYYQVQQQLFTTNRPFCDFVVCSIGLDQFMLVHQRILPDKPHWDSVVPTLEKFWRICILPEVLGRWYTNRRDAFPVNKTSSKCKVCYCRSEREERTVKCCNANCSVKEFHLPCLGIEIIPKTWYCPNCRVLLTFKPAQRKKDTVDRAIKLELICSCQTKATASDKLLECMSGACESGTFFHLACLKYKRMPRNSISWVCSSCAISTKSLSNKLNCSPKSFTCVSQSNPSPQPSSVSQAMPMPHPSSGNKRSTPDCDNVVFTKRAQNSSLQCNKYAQLGSLTQCEYGLIKDPLGWLDCVVIHKAQVLLSQIDKNIKGFQRPTVGAVRQFDVMTGDFIKIVHINNNHWVCMTSIDSTKGYVIVLDSLMSPISQELQELAENLVGENFKGVHKANVQQQQNGSDCGVFSIAFATCLAYGKDPSTVKFNIPQMRSHLIQCLQSGIMKLFPTTET